jgi:hypothetical protein
MHRTGVVGALSPARQRAPQRPPPRAGVPAPGRYPVVRLAEDAWRQALAALEAAREAPYPPASETSSWAGRSAKRPQCGAQ